ncbi:hypothetical protein [uncultured Microbulbifer sp.]|uniref:hypothetical protein n=1 Tax=uncultured Microbulbifer sp. TaxID=348147 RepID=UPI0025E38787|nr:hypothetical protein [uncultured Microbulbifer sp.]
MTTTQLTELRKTISTIIQMIRRTNEALAVAYNAGQTDEQRLNFAESSIKHIATVVHSMYEQTDCYEDLKCSKEVQNAHNYLYQATVQAGDLCTQEGFDRLIVGIDGAMNELEHANAKAKLPIVTVEDEQAIRRAVWSAFHRTGAAPCPYPAGHNHREIWADECTAIAAEFSNEILAAPPQAEVITLEEACRELNFQDALRVFGELPIYDVQDGEAIPFPTQNPSPEQPDKEEPLPAAAVH